MKLDVTTDSSIRNSLKKHDIHVDINIHGYINIHEYKMDSEAKAGMLYLKPKSEIPNGKLPFLVVDAKGVYGVFYKDKKALIIEVSLSAMQDESTK